jgi:hypothetical protein
MQEDIVRRDDHYKQMQVESRRLEQQMLSLQATHMAHKQASPDAAAKRENCRGPDTSMLSHRSAMQSTPPGSASREDARVTVGRQVSSSITRQLFTQPGETDPPLSARGLNRHTSEPAQGLQTLASNSQGGMPTTIPATATVRVLSSALPRPSPRGAPSPAAAASSIQCWRSHSQGAAPIAASPRGAKAIAAMQGIDSRPAAQVRTLVNEFERRSTSQTPAGAPRGFETTTTTPSRAPAMVPNTARAHSAAAPCATRAPSHGPLPISSREMVARRDASARGRRHLDEMEAPNGSPHREDSNGVVFGMSPMNRPRSERCPVTHLRGGLSTPSPQHKPGPSVQDRIRALNVQQGGRL